ncbi:hypothetical protein GQ457_09G023660 [Hibiscus cannabinus]
MDFFLIELRLRSGASCLLEHGVVQNESRKWNTNVFGHIEKRKRFLLARIKGVERELERSPNSFLEGLDKELKRELDVVLAQEESLWHQKARSSWIENGDRNTRFFHTSVMARRKRNTIRMLRIDGHWIFGDKRRKMRHRPSSLEEPILIIKSDALAVFKISA